MTTTGLKNRLSRTAAVLAVAVLGAIGLTPGVAHASQTCPSGYFCWYYLENQNGSYGLQFNYTSGWIRMNTLVDDSESSMDSFTGHSCPTTVYPYVYLSDTYLSLRWTANVATGPGQRVNTFNPIYVSGTNTPSGSMNMNNKFNDIWAACR